MYYVYSFDYNLPMNTKEQVLDILKKADGAYVSGEELASKAAVSRAAIWKAVQALQTEGYDIEGVSRRGYSLKAADVFSEREIASYLEIPFYFFEEIDSTNNKSRQLVNEGVSAPFAVIAERQTGGKGRRGRSFVSSEGGVYFTIALRNNGEFNVESVTTAACTGVARAIDSLGFESRIKWVNDIYLGERKAVGILTEGIVNLEEHAVSDIIIGIGINYATREFPEELKDIVTSLYPDGNPPMSRSRFVAMVINEVLQSLSEPDYLETYKRKCFILGKAINVIRSERTVPAVALDLDEKAHLIVRYEDGAIEHLSSGEVSIRERK